MKWAAIMISVITAPLAQAEGTFACIEVERVSVARDGKMRPVFEGRPLNFTWADDMLSGDGVFYHKTYQISVLGEGGFRAFAQDADRSDLFRFEDNVLMHTAIVKYGQEPSVQAQVFTCNPAG